MSPLVTGLLKLAARIGRWILDLASRRGGAFLRRYLEERVLVFRARLKRAKTDRRRAWLNGRIDRWTAASRWLARNEATLDDRAIALACEHPSVKGLPMTALCEVAPA